MLDGEPISESQREDNAQGAAHERVNETQVGKDTRGGYTARKAEVSDFCIPAQVLVKAELGRRGTRTELQQRAVKREISGP